MFVLKTERLRVEVAEPSELTDRTTRFDHAAFIRQIILDEKLSFCAEEPIGPGGLNSGGKGLCSEFQLLPTEIADDTYILKMGVGLLKRRGKDHYNPFQRYVYIPSEVSVEQDDGSLRFTSALSMAPGYAVTIRRTIMAEENRILLTNEVENSGENILSFREYCHNFLSMDGSCVGPEYCLELPGVKDLESCVRQNPRSEQMFHSEAQRLYVAACTAKPARFSVDRADIAEGPDFFWKLSHTQTGGWVEGTAYFRPSEVTVWAKDNVFCPEVFYQNTLCPGESCLWQRTWKFGRDLQSK